MTCITCGASIAARDTACPVCGTPAAAAIAEPSAGTPEHTEPMRGTAEHTEPTRGESEHTEPTRGESGWGGPPPPTGSAPAGGPAPVGSGFGPPVTHPSGLSSEVRGWGIAAHLVGLGGALLTAVTLGFLGPLFIWLVKREDHPFIEHHAKESLNFQLTTLLALVVGAIAIIPVALIGILTLGLLWLFAAIAVLAAVLAWLVFPILGAAKAANGEGFRYPVSIRFVR